MGKFFKGSKGAAEPTVEHAPSTSPSAGIPGSRAVEVRYEPQAGNEDDLTADLMRLIGQAIDVWARRHGLTNMPPDIVFDQALLALNEVHRLAEEQRRRQG